MSISELRVKDLREELRRAEADVAATSAQLSKFEQARRALHEAERLLNLNRGQRVEIEQQIGALESKFKRTDPLFSEKRSGVLAEARNYQGNVRKLTLEAEKLEKDVQLKKIALQDEQAAIARNPFYAKLRDAQNALVPEAERLANLVFETPLKDLRLIFLKIQRLVETEAQIVTQARVELRRAGLPELTEMLANFFAQAVPKEELLRLLENRNTEQWTSQLREMSARPFRT